MSLRIGDHLGIPTASIPADRLEAHFGFLAALIALDNPTASLVTRRVLGREPAHPACSPTSTPAIYFTTTAPYN